MPKVPNYPECSYRYIIPHNEILIFFGDIAYLYFFKF
ncbi:hypothetical protein EF53_238 [Enterococcus phage 53]|nr:hypothetical protein EF53_238 [Enterococcus phage 53]